MAFVFAVMFTLGGSAIAESRRLPNDPWLGPRNIFFNDYFLFSAEQEVMTMAGLERRALGKLLEVCLEAHTAEVPRLRCEIARLQYLMDHRQGRKLDRLLDAVQFMTSQFRYNGVIGRESEAGLMARLGAIHAGLADAVRLNQPDTEISD